MGFKRNVISFSLLSILFFSNNAQASKLPNDVWQFVKNNLPKAQQRFDSVVTVSDDVMYIPLYPPSETQVEKLAIEYTYPLNKNLSALPEVILLNNGFSFLKVFKDNKGNYTLTQKDDLPIKVRLGLMPQDMLTPIGLKMPESLKLTLGDLLIPSKEEGSLNLNEEEKAKVKSPFNPTIERNNFVSAVELKDKKVLINTKNSKFLSVFDYTDKKPLYELKLTSMPLKIITCDKSKVALVLYWNSNSLEILDLKDERIISTIKAETKPCDVVLDSENNIAYVSFPNENSIYQINLNTMKLDKIIKVDQRPSKLAYCASDKSIAFFDEFSATVYNLVQEEEKYLVKKMGSAQNVVKIISDNENIFAISRVQNELYVYNKEEMALKNTILLDKKPTDALLYKGKIFILCAQDAYLDVFDINKGKITSRELLNKDGFYSKMTLIPDGNNIMITGFNSKNYLIYDLETMKIVKKQDSYIDVSNIIILEKNQRL